VSTADRWHLTVAALLGEPLPELPLVPPERCHRHAALPPDDGRDHRMQSYAKAAQFVAALAPGWRGWRP
jgi:hypothetical protein